MKQPRFSTVLLILKAIKKNKDCSISQIFRETYITYSHLHQIYNNLVGLGIVSDVKSGRTRYSNLTLKGEKLLNTMVQIEKVINLQ